MTIWDQDTGLQLPLETLYLTSDGVFLLEGVDYGHDDAQYPADRQKPVEVWDFERPVPDVMTGQEVIESGTLKTADGNEMPIAYMSYPYFEKLANIVITAGPSPHARYYDLDNGVYASREENERYGTLVLPADQTIDSRQLSALVAAAMTDRRAVTNKFVLVDEVLDEVAAGLGGYMLQPDGFLNIEIDSVVDEDFVPVGYVAAGEEEE